MAPAGELGDVSLRDLANAAYQAGYSVHGDLNLGIDDFGERLFYVMRRCPRTGDDTGDELSARAQLLKQLHTTDLYLSTACALRRDKAWFRFDTIYRKYMNDLVTFICSTHSIASEIRDTTSVHLFLPDRTGQCRIASYDGRSSLATWLRVIIT